MHNKEREKKKKMQAFQSFLQKGDDSKSLDLRQSSTNLSETDERVEDGPQTECCVCRSDVG